MLRFPPFVRVALVLYRSAAMIGMFVVLSGLWAVPLQAQMKVDARGDAVAIRAFGNDTSAGFLAKERIRLQLSELSSISAIEAVADGKAAMALVARGMHADNSKEQSLVFVPIAWEAIVAITHPANPVQNISLRQLREIYAGRIKTWDQIGGRAEPIHLSAVAGPMDGVEYGMRKALFGRGHIPVAAERWYLNTAQLEAAVAIDPNGLAVSALSNVRRNPKLKRLMLEGVLATRSNVKQGEYLLVTPIYLVHRADEAGTGSVARYLQFLRSDRPSRLAMQKKKLLPIREADLLNEIFAMREEKILAMLEASTIAKDDGPVAAAIGSAKPATPPAETSDQSP